MFLSSLQVLALLPNLNLTEGPLVRLREALLNCGLGSALPQSHSHTLIIRSNLTPDKVIRRCERVMAGR